MLGWEAPVGGMAPSMPALARVAPSMRALARAALARVQQEVVRAPEAGAGTVVEEKLGYARKSTSPTRRWTEIPPCR